MMRQHVLGLRLLGSSGTLALSALAAQAQQFNTVTPFPGAPLWSEGVECADVDNDGDLDVFVADGDGFASAGTQRQNLLFMNKLIEGTPWSLVDESVARLGVHISNAKGVTTGDINGDGWVDALFANAFSTKPPHLYVNVGSATPGFFTYESATRGFTTNFNSGSACFADLDDDGDLDVILNDSYNVNGGNRVPHLYINTGAGVFVENPAALGAPLKSQQMDVQFSDVDNDFDLDFLEFNKNSGASAHYLMLNTGTGTFTDSSSLITSGSGASYEAEVGDLDGDNDSDLFFVSIAGFAEGAARNNKIGTGVLGFTNQSNLGGDDDNEIALFDYDIDGDYDVFVGSLGAREKLWRNDGAFTFTNQHTAIQAQGDSTLDMAVADLNNDGKYDLITVQGESGVFTNKFYRNNGAADTLAPRLVAESFPASAPAASSIVVKAKIRDQVLDDGVNYVTGSATYVVRTSIGTAAVSIDPGAFTPSSLTITPGTTVTWTNASGTNQSVDLISSPYDATSGTIVASATYAYTFVNPGTYVYTSTLGGFSGTVNVVGIANLAGGFKMGEQLYRFRLDDTAGGAGLQLCYELRFRDWVGNVSVTRSHCIPLTGGGTGTTFCAGDGSAGACPCGNTAAPGSGTGCLSSLGMGALLVASGSPSVSADTLVLAGSGMPNSSALYYQGSTAVNGGLGVPFGDGLRCAGGTIFRIGLKTNVSGASNYPVAGDASVSVRGNVVAGDVRRYQVWYRNAAAFCTVDTFNLSNGRTITWAP